MKYLAVVMICAAWLILPMRDSSLSVFILFKYRDDMISCTQDVYFSLGRKIWRERVWMFHSKHSCVQKSDLLPQFCGVREGHLVSEVRHIATVWIWFGWPIRVNFWSDTPTMGCQWYWWWVNQLIHPLRPILLQYSLPVGLPWLVGMRQVDSPPWVVSVY